MSRLLFSGTRNIIFGTLKIYCTNSTLCRGGEVDDVVAVDGDDGDDDIDIDGAF